MPEDIQKNKKLVPISEAAEFLGVSIDTIRRWDKQGIIHSERPNGKDRYFSLEELENHKIAKPISISAAATMLKVSPTTLRRLEKKGLIACEKNSNGERVFAKEHLEKFLNSKYYLRKAGIQEKILEPFNQTKEEKEEEKSELSKEEKGLLQEIVIETVEHDVERRNPAGVNLKPWSRIPELLISGALFALLLGIGVKNVSDIDKSPKTISTTLGVNTTSSKPKIMVTIKNIETKSSIDIKQKPTNESKKVGEAKDGDKFELISEDAGWYQVKLPDGSIGFISSSFVEAGGANN